MPEPIPSILTGLGIWLLAMAAIHGIVRPLIARPVQRGAILGILWHLNRVVCRVLHRVRCSGSGLIPAGQNPGPLIIVSNHTGSVDPLVIQSTLPFFVRWMMASEMMSPAARDLWETLQIIPVARDGKDSSAAREAIRYVKAGGVVGIFPEGGIVEPRGVIWPFFDGVGLIIARTRAPVLLVWVDGTPETTDMRTSLLTPSHAHVTFVDLIDFGDERDVRAITRSLRERLAQVSGWTIVDGNAVARFAQQPSSSIGAN